LVQGAPLAAAVSSEAKRWLTVKLRPIKKVK